MILRFTVKAQRDLASHFVRTEKRSPRKAIADDEKIWEACLLLLDFPGMGRAGRLSGTQEYVVPDTPYILAYRIDDEILRVVRIMHGAQLWPRSMPKL